RYDQCRNGNAWHILERRRRDRAGGRSRVQKAFTAIAGQHLVELGARVRSVRGYLHERMARPYRTECVEPLFLNELRPFVEAWSVGAVPRQREFLRWRR